MMVESPVNPLVEMTRQFADRVDQWLHSGGRLAWRGTVALRASGATSLLTIGAQGVELQPAMETEAADVHMVGHPVVLQAILSGLVSPITAARQGQVAAIALGRHLMALEQLFGALSPHTA